MGFRYFKPSFVAQSKPVLSQPPEQEMGFVNRVLDWASMPGFALRNVLSGKPEAALRNLAEFGVKGSTFTFLHGVGSDTFAFTRKKERPEFTDLLKTWGVDVPRKGLSKFGLDFVGGILTDPLSYLSFGATGVGKGALGAALKEGNKALARKIVAGELGGNLAKLAAKHSEDLLAIPKYSEFSTRLAKRYGAERGTEVFKKYAEKHMLDYMISRGGPAGFRIGFMPGLVGRGIPIGPMGTNPIIDALKYTAPGLLFKAAPKSFQRAISSNVKGIGRTLSSQLWEKSGIIANPILRQEARRLETARRIAVDTGNQNVDRIFEEMRRGISPETIEKLGSLFHDAGDVNSRGVLEAGINGIIKDLPQAEQVAVTGMKDKLLSEFDRILQESKDILHRLHGVEKEVYLPRQLSVEARDLMLRAGPRRGLTTSGINDVFMEQRKFESAQEFIDHWTKVMKNNFNITDDQLKSIKILETNPLKLYRTRAQAHELAKAEHGFLTGMGDLLGVKDVKSDAKKIAEMEASLPWGLRPGEQIELPHPLTGKPKDKDWETIAKYQAAIKDKPREYIPIKYLTSKEIKEYLNLVMTNHPDVAQFMDKVAGLKPTGKFMSILGILNSYYKPALTIIDPKFHIRNAISSIFMAMTDPDISRTGTAKAALKSIGYMIPSKIARDVGMSRLDTILKLIRNPSDPKLFEAARAVTYRGKNGVEWAERLRGVLPGQTFIDNETLLRKLDGLPEPGPVTNTLKKAGKPGKAVLNISNKYLSWAADVAKQTEEYIRATAFMDLVASGHSDLDAAKRVADAFVDYSYVSELNRGLRQVMPFIQFTLGTAKSLGKATIERPYTAGMYAPAFRSTSGAVVPRFVSENIAIPYGTDENGQPRFISSLGLPIETLSSFGPLTLAETKRTVERALSQTTPVIKAPAEMVMGRYTYSGQPIGAYRKADQWVHKIPVVGDVLQKIGVIQETKLANGKKGFEYTDRAQAILSALPEDRLEGMISQWFDERQDWSSKIVNLSTGGVKIRSFDQKKQIEAALVSKLTDYARRGKVREFTNFWQVNPSLDPEITALIQQLSSLRSERKKANKASKPIASPFGITAGL